MAFNIRIKPLVLFDLEDKIRQHEMEAENEGKRFYQSFLTGLSDLQCGIQNDEPVYKTVKKHVPKDTLCRLFYTITGNTVSVIGLL